MPSHPSPVSTLQDCFRYWDLADSLKIDRIVALWCGMNPSEVTEFKREEAKCPLYGCEACSD